ncbi:DeoR/GlpR family DNA-binding transcription regulator [Boudabousia liubingyangii]|uniref:hypothetical protein n=1 Tax=Boudabousia liubingyangii TaxID=1921764 RepID=UPI0022AAD002|nr:hypothetical protein [Boudabousia liubingyangii]
MDAIVAGDGFYADNAEEVAISQAMINRARYTVAVADHTKAEATAFAKICSFSEINELLIGPGVDAEVLTSIRNQGVKIWTPKKAFKEGK